MLQQFPKALPLQVCPLPSEPQRASSETDPAADEAVAIVAEAAGVAAAVLQLPYWDWHPLSVEQ